MVWTGARDACFMNEAAREEEEKEEEEEPQHQDADEECEEGARTRLVKESLAW